MTRTLAPALAALFLAAPAAAPAERPAPDCGALVVPYERRAEVRGAEFALDLPAAGGGHLTYQGSPHTSDPADPAIAEIERAFARSKPTIAFYEGPDRPVAGTREETIRSTGESGYVRFLAGRAGIPVARLEPSPADELAYVSSKFPADQVQLFFVLREAARLRDRKGLGEPELRAAVAQLLGRAAAMGLTKEGGITTLEQLDAAYRRYWTTPERWWQAPGAWFDPGKSSAETGGLFTNEINKASSHYRDMHMVKVLAEAARSGQRVFAVVGRDHVPMQAGALRCALK